MNSFNLITLGPAATSCLCYKTIFVPSHPHFVSDHTLYDMQMFYKTAFI